MPVLVSCTWYLFLFTTSFPGIFHLHGFNYFFVFMGLAINVYIVKNVLERFVFRKIKVIYKIIRDAKLTKKEKESVDIGSATFEAVTEDVIEWTRDTQQEIESLKSLEEYRKSYVGNISHELKTPIFSIQGYLHTLLDGGLEDPSINRNYLKKQVAMRTVCKT
ncbi:MAG: hypothetical protein IPK46_19295 [Saprospiraceae bacterium]|nr:hypothetical protein [Saprospiraceae bacterium]